MYVFLRRAVFSKQCRWLSSPEVSICVFALFSVPLPFSSHSSCLSARFHAYSAASLPRCTYICLRAFLSAPRVLWDCHKVLITHMTSPTSCLPCILGLSGLKNPFTRLPLYPPPPSPLLSLPSSPCLLFFSSRFFPGLSPWCSPARGRESKLLTFGFCRNHRTSGCTVFQIVSLAFSLSLVLPPLLLVNRALHHQPYRAGPRRVACDKTPHLAAIQAD